MLYKEISLYTEENPTDAKLIIYIQNYSKDMLVQKRPMVILCPGGGYNHISDREAESVALQFMAMGCHAAILRYSVYPAKYPAQITELAYSMKIIRENASEWHIDEDKIVVQGSSAGGHLAMCLGVFWMCGWLYKSVGTHSAYNIKPNGILLSYPVITTGEFAHKGSFELLVGDDKELLSKLSLENQVNEHTPSTFIWHTFTDESVPVENSLLMVSALRRQNIPTQFHLYPQGGHGLALASPLTASRDGSHMQKECESWIDLAHTWILGL